MLRERLAFASLCAVRQGGPAELLLLANVPGSSRPPEPPALARLLTDRAVYKLNDTVRVKGYVRVQDGEGRLSVPHAWGATYTLRVLWRGSGAYSETTVGVDAAYGAFDASLLVPTDARYGEHQISLRALRLDSRSERYPQSLASTTVAVADPRPPTVELHVATPSARVLSPDVGTIPLTIRTASISGVPLRAQRVTLRWSLTRGPTPPALLRVLLAGTSVPCTMRAPPLPPPG